MATYTVKDNYETGTDGDRPMNSSTYLCQSFTASSAYDIAAISLKLYRIDEPGNVTVELYLADDVTNKPTGAVLATGTIDGNALTANTVGEWKVALLDTVVSLTNGEEYVIVAHASNFTTSCNWIEDDSPGSYTDGQGGTSNDGAGAVWSMDVSRDHYFRTLTAGSDPLGGTTAPVDKTYSKELIAIGNNEVWRESVENGTATGGTATTLVDSDRTEADDYFNNWRLTIVSGVGIGETATITNYINVSGTFEFAALSGGSTPDTTSRYTVDKMSAVAAAHNDIDTTDVLNVTVAFQKLFIINGTNKKVLDFVNTKITTADINPGAADGPPDFGAVITVAATGASMIVDYITAIDGICTIYGKRTTTVTFADTDVVTGTNASTSPYYGTAGAISFTLNADEVSGLHWYNYTVFGADATNYGVMPTKVYEICRYRGRIQLCRDPNYPHQWYQSRQLNPFDFLYVAGDAQSPVAGNNADCAEVGDVVVVAIPYSDDYLIYGCASELWVMSGDAAFGGELNPLDTTTGILGDRAWCWDDKSNLYMLGTAGLLRIPQGFGQIENLTRELWPDFVEDLAFDSSIHRLVLAFDPEKFGIHIFKTTLKTGACVGWWYDFRTEGLFPDTIPTAMGIYSAFYYQTEDPTYKKLLVGCADGYIKSFNKATKNDDGTTITSYVGFAPLALSTHPRKDGIIKNFDIVTGIGDFDSDGVTCTVHVARTAAQIIKKLNDGDTAALTKVFTTPNWTKSNLDRRSIRGQWAALVLTNSTDGESWSMERLIVDSKEIGRSL